MPPNRTPCPRSPVRAGCSELLKPAGKRAAREERDYCEIWWRRQGRKTDDRQDKVTGYEKPGTCDGWKFLPDHKSKKQSKAKTLVLCRSGWRSCWFCGFFWSLKCLYSCTPDPYWFMLNLKGLFIPKSKWHNLPAVLFVLLCCSG